ncbi:hypothetical protein RMCBS344292_14074 [Rhizopus microsporus]|nr:hypothetical protein RMCBS344292_14074 [Rhizopus microsporus]
MEITLEKTRRLLVYCWATGKELNKDARQFSIKTLRLPDNLKYLEEDDDDEDKNSSTPTLLRRFNELDLKIQLCVNNKEEMKNNVQVVLNHLSVYHQLQERLGIQAIAGFPQIHVQQPQDGNSCAAREDFQTSEPSSSTEKCDKKILVQVDSELIGEGHSYDIGNGEELLRARFLQRDLARSLKIQGYNWEKSCEVSTQAWNELNWWIEKATLKNGPPIQ